MILSDIRLRTLTVALALGAVFLGLQSTAREISDAVVEELFSRHKESEWRPLAERWDEVKAKATAPVENLSLPLEYHPGGLVKARLYAEKAQIFPDGTVFATGVKVHLYALSGKPDGYLKADDCLFDRQASHGYCKGRVEVVKDSDLIKGVGMYFSISKEFIKILSNCEIRTNRLKGDLGRYL